MYWITTKLAHNKHKSEEYHLIFKGHLKAKFPSNYCVSAIHHWDSYGPLLDVTAWSFPVPSGHYDFFEFRIFAIQLNFLNAFFQRPVGLCYQNLW